MAARGGAAMESIAQEVEERHGVEVTVMPKDLARHGASAELMSSLDQRGVTIDALVNNAGFSTYGEFWRDDPATQSDMLAVNVVALTELSRLVVPGMVERGRGRVLHLGSVGSFSAAPMTAAYAATKAYVLSLSLAMAEELAGTGVTVTCLCPGPTRDRLPGASRHGRVRPDQRQAPSRGARGGRSGLRRDEGGHALSGHGSEQSSVRVRVAVPAAHDDGAHRRPLAAPGLSRDPRRRGDRMLKEFKEFAFKGNVLEVAIGLTLALAFTGVVNALIQGVLMPIVAALFGEPNFDSITIGIGDRGEILIGSLITAIVNFLLIAWVLFLIVKAANRLRTPDVEEEAGPTEVELLTQIRDSLQRSGGGR